MPSTPLHPRLGVALSLDLLAGCPAGDNTELEPPPDFVGDSDLNQYLFANFDAEDPVRMQQGVEALIDQLAEVDLTGDQGDRRWNQPTLLTEEYYGGATIWADADPYDQVSVAVAGWSAFPPAEQATITTIADQTPFESSSSAAYNRTVRSGGDCFASGDCAVLDTINEVHRDNALLDVWYDTPKFFRWIELTDGTSAFVARAWLEEAYTGENGANTLEQFTALEVKAPLDGGTLLYTIVWGASDPPLGEVIVQNATANGIDEAWEKTDTFLGE